MAHCIRLGGAFACGLGLVSLSACGSGAVGPRAADSGADVASAGDVSASDAGVDRGSGPDIGGGGGPDVIGSPPTTVWRPFADSSPWNTPIPVNATVDPASAAMVADLASIPGQDTIWINIQDYSVPVYWVDSTTQPLVSVMAGLGGTGFRTGAPKEGDVAGTGLAPIPPNAMAAVGTDRHLAVVDKVVRTEWGFFNASRSGAGWTVDLAATQDLAGSGVRPPEHDSPWWAGHGPRACGFGLIAGLITTDEIRAGKIEHALVLAYPHIRSRYYTPPASSAQAGFGDALPTRGVMCGGRVQLDPSLDITTLGLSAQGRVIARALQEYGAFVGDYSGAVSLYADESPDAQAYWKTAGLGNNTAEKIPLNRFRVLEIGMTIDNMN